MKVRRPTSVKPEFDTLEDRSVPATASLRNGVLSVLGSNIAETIRVTQVNDTITVEGVGRFSARTVKSITVDARAGDDYIDLRTLRIGATVYAGAGNDRVVGTLAADSIFGGLGNDRVFALSGNDVIYGEAGNDVLLGQDGYDYLLGGDGVDFLDDGNRFAQEYADGGAGLDFNADVVAINGTTLHDVHQQGAPTCSFLSTLSGLARLGTDFTKWVRYAGYLDGNPQYDVAFWKSGGWTWTRVAFDGTLNWTDTKPAVEGESWVVLMQRAWIRFHGNNGAAWPEQAYFALTGRTAAVQHYVADADFQRIANALRSNRLVITATVSNPSARTLVGDHAYTVVDTWGSGSNLWVRVRNPWGVDGGREAYADPNDGLIWVRWSDFKTNMRYLAIG